MPFSICFSFLSQVDAEFIYLGSKFIKETVKLPSYFSCQNTLRYVTVKPKLSEIMEKYIQTDIENFESNFKLAKTTSEEKFVKVNNAKQVWVFAPRRHVNLSDIKITNIFDWGITLQKEDNVLLSECSDPEHKYHDFLAPFHFTNEELLSFYEHITRESDEERKSAISEDFQLLSRIKDEPLSSSHENTIFHCSGHPIEASGYKETDWTVRLYYSLRRHLPITSNLRPSYSYEKNFAALQQLFSGQSSSMYYYCRGAPDLLLSTKTSRSGAGIGVLHVTELTDVIEIKNNYLSMARDKAIDIPIVTGELVGGLHFMVVAKVLSELKQGRIPTEVMCKGLLLKRKDTMMLFRVVAKISRSDAAEAVTCYYKRLFNCDKNSVTPGHVCAAIQELIK